MPPKESDKSESKSGSSAAPCSKAEEKHGLRRPRAVNSGNNENASSPVVAKRGLHNRNKTKLAGAVPSSSSIGGRITIKRGLRHGNNGRLAQQQQQQQQRYEQQQGDRELSPQSTSSREGVNKKGLLRNHPPSLVQRELNHPQQQPSPNTCTVEESSPEQTPVVAHEEGTATSTNTIVEQQPQNAACDTESEHSEQNDAVQFLDLEAPDDLNLVEAHAVHEEELAAPLPRARPVNLERFLREERERAKNRKCRRVGMCILAMAAVALGVGVPLSLQSRNQPKVVIAPPLSNATTPSTLSPTTSAVTAAATPVPIMTNLSMETLEAVNTPGSPQQRAYEWVSDHWNFSNFNDWRRKQLFAMATFHYAMDGDHWPEHIKRSWLNPDTDECNWYADEDHFNSEEQAQEWELEQHDLPMCIIAPERCNAASLLSNVSDVRSEPHTCNKDGELTSLTFGVREAALGNGVVGPNLNTEENFLNNPSIPPEISLLTELTTLHLEGQGIVGTIPSAIGSLSKLENLELQANKLVGSIFTEIGNMQALRHLNLESNGIDGTFPSQFGLLPALETLCITNNSMTGPLPHEIGLLSGSLTVFDATLADVFGVNLPNTTDTRLDFFMDVATLTSLALNENSFRGSLPSEICLLTNVTTLLLDNNAFTGVVPSELALMTNLQSLYLHETNLTGTIPLELCDVPGWQREMLVDCQKITCSCDQCRCNV